MTPLMMISVFVSTYMCIVQGQTPCRTPNAAAGQCIPVPDCPELYTLINKRRRDPEEVKFLRASFCGYQGSTPKVCCEVKTSALKTCFTPDGDEGQCTGLYSCPHIVELLAQKPIPSETVQFVQNSKCDGPEQYSVCCGPNKPRPAKPAPQPIPAGQCRLTAAPPDPKTECCGRDASAGNRIIGGNVTAVDQYPWLALIEYQGQDNRIKLLCGASLISSKYVLTAGHCVAGSVLSVGRPINIRLGEYDTSNSGPDCVPAEGGGEDCTDGLVIIPIERTIPHPEYNPVDRLRRNDIALIRMKDAAPYTDFIRPICLPTTDVSAAPPRRFNLFVSGWGAVNTSVASSNIKLHVDLPYSPMSTCQSAYSTTGRRITLWQGQICAGGVEGKDSCKGDSGGPLMYENGRIFELIGVVSFGPTPCGLYEVPGVYTKVFEYNRWIRNTIRP